MTALATELTIEFENSSPKRNSIRDHLLALVEVVQLGIGEGLSKLTMAYENEVKPASLKIKDALMSVLSESKYITGEISQLVDKNETIVATEIREDIEKEDNFPLDVWDSTAFGRIVDVVTFGGKRKKKKREGRARQEKPHYKCKGTCQCGGGCKKTGRHFVHKCGACK